MDVQTLTYLFVGGSFALYIGIAIWSRAGSTKDFYVAGGGVSPIANGAATAADWMSAASFISMAGIIAYAGYDASVYLMGWTGGYVLLAMLLAPYLRKFGKFTVPDFIGDRYYSNVARTVAVICVIFVSFTYVAGQMRGTGIVFARFLEVNVNTGVVIGMAIVFFYAVLGGMKGITYTQVAQYCVLIFAFLVPAVFLSIMMTGHVLPQTGFGATVLDAAGNDSGVYLLHKLDQVVTDLGFTAYTDGSKSTVDVFFIAAALMCGTAGLPHVIVRFFTVPRVKDARISAGWALFFIALLYTSAPAVGAFARLNLIDTVHQTQYEELPEWFYNWENSGLIGWMDKNGDGAVQMSAGAAFEGKPTFAGSRAEVTGAYGERVLTNAPSDNDAEVYIDRDIIVLANPEIGNLPAWVIALVAAGGVAAALSTAAGLLLVISSAISHDLLKKTLKPDITEKQELLAARGAAVVAICIAGYFGINPPGFVAQVVAFAFGLAAASFFPVILMGIFYKRMNKEGAIAGMLTGLAFTFSYIVYFKFVSPELNSAEHWLLGVSPEGIGTVGMLLNFAVAFAVSRVTAPPPEHIQHIVEDIRVPRGAGEAVAH
ncbi:MULTISPECIES: sodium:solute symporter family protein [unclassified Alcanivorax]|jgi:cation/acetate symporter|uniref:sodium:solute symporter family protein n=1 Tax=unclassified Alcanivorax TaxID=2638842 RepID=UPI000789F06C|nr:MULTISPECIES: sodium:solute symporter family protein [unclassified Alcanivorax]KZX76110.1 cation acetate symporter [Alcanivorax sp. HI0013]KZX77972.1 cation acetate symporter [Alcanivorax sp. HI0011]KZY10630.1 cation acetate symporter [Alcanivorax sp. HI0035]MEE2601692.1 sodium:solute symporter family protein [Pseudomonadota bacterium]KZX64958.1 cation acetate symporter [Alcanivorax sp. HI0003]|tara:strand:+ start:1560 stop:3356 length:1797 start_codon:yes stop_codon:yes gene_type:complete